MQMKLLLPLIEWNVDDTDCNGCDKSGFSRVVSHWVVLLTYGNEISTEAVHPKVLWMFYDISIHLSLPSCVCVCASGESTGAVQIDLHHGRARPQWERRSRTVSSSGHVGEPIAFKHNHNMTDSLRSDSDYFLNQLSSSTLCISLFSSFVIALYFLWLFSLDYTHAHSV